MVPGWIVRLSRSSARTPLPKFLTRPSTVTIGSAKSFLLIRAGSYHASGGYNTVKQLHNDDASVDPDRSAAMERLFELAILVNDSIEAGLAQRGLTRARAELLLLLHRQGPMTQRALSQAMRCSPRNVTGLVDGLEADGYVVRRPHPTDRRATLVTL